MENRCPALAARVSLVALWVPCRNARTFDACVVERARLCVPPATGSLPCAAPRISTVKAPGVSSRDASQVLADPCPSGCGARQG